MMLVEETTVPLAALPLATFREHLRMGTGFADDTLQDGLLERYLRAAMAAIEARTGKVLISRTFSWSLSRWRDTRAQTMPVAPVEIVTGLTIIDRMGDETVIDAAMWHLEQDALRPQLVASLSYLPVVPYGGKVRVDFIAGYGPAWSDVPGDLAQATLMLAGHFYEFRHSAEGRGVEMPADVAALIAPHRNMRIYLGGRSE